MDELLRSLDAPAGATVFSLPEVIVALALSFVLSLMFVYVYGVTHRGLSHSVGYVHSMVIMAVTTTVIMLIIGSNIARAFSLVGALSIIRFRNAVKETRDVGFLFMAMATGMACGTGFYPVAVAFTLFACVMVYALNRFGVGTRSKREMVLTVHLPDGKDHRTVFNEVFYQHLEDHSLLSMESIRAGTLLELVFAIKLKTGGDEAALLQALRAVTDNHKVALMTGTDNAEL